MRRRKTRGRRRSSKKRGGKRKLRTITLSRGGVRL